LFLSSYLHDLGVILHFQDDSTLCHWIILNPQWVTDAIYTILSTKNLVHQKGRFTRKWLFDTWQNRGYSFEEKNQLLNLMKKDNLDLCYQLYSSNGINEYIVPQLLPTDQPRYEWNNDENLRFCFQYPFLPKGVITQIIVRLSNYIIRIKDVDLVWRYGVVLTKNDSSSIDISEETKAEIIEEIGKDGLRAINIRVSGSSFERKGFLTIIIKEILEIHKKFGEITWYEKVPCNCCVCDSHHSPQMYDFQGQLKYRLSQGRQTIECDKSLKQIEIINLVDAVIDAEGKKLLDRFTNNTKVGQEGIANAIEGELKIRCKKLAELRLALGTEAGKSMEFQLQAEVKKEEQKIQELERRLNGT
jgi:internalin A